MNAVHWREDYPAFAEWFISRCLPEPHSTKAIEDGVGWALDTDPETLIATALRRMSYRGRRTLRALAQNLRLPGTRDPRRPRQDHAASATAARWRGSAADAGGR